MEASAKSNIKIHDKLYIDGRWIKPSGSGLIDVINSTTEEVMDQSPRGRQRTSNWL